MPEEGKVEGRARSLHREGIGGCPEGLTGAKPEGEAAGGKGRASEDAQGEGGCRSPGERDEKSPTPEGCRGGECR